MDEKKKKVLIAEDEKPMANAVKLKLEKEGIEAVIAINGQEAVDFVKKENFDLVLLDLIMPVKDGFTALKEIRESGINVPVIIASNLSQGEDIEKAKKLGAIEYFVKSDTPISEVVGKVKKALSLSE